MVIADGCEMTGAGQVSQPVSGNASTKASRISSKAVCNSSKHVGIVLSLLIKDTIARFYFSAGCLGIRDRAGSAIPKAAGRGR
jgi:hypothetical protein